MRLQIHRLTLDGVHEAWSVTGPPALCAMFMRLGAFGVARKETTMTVRWIVERFLHRHKDGVEADIGEGWRVLLTAQHDRFEARRGCQALHQQADRASAARSEPLARRQDDSDERRRG